MMKNIYLLFSGSKCKNFLMAFAFFRLSFNILKSRLTSGKRTAGMLAEPGIKKLKKFRNPGIRQPDLFT